MMFSINNSRALDCALLRLHKAALSISQQSKCSIDSFFLRFIDRPRADAHQYHRDPPPRKLLRMLNAAQTLVRNSNSTDNL